MRYLTFALTKGRLASKTLESMQDGLNRESAQEICQLLLLPGISALVIRNPEKLAIKNGI